jgi:hypothetical protein
MALVNLQTANDLLRLVERQIPESPSLEYKSELPLGSRRERVEVLKDLTGMGNGGGGTVIFGISEDPELDGVPGALAPLTDMGLIGALEDIARSGVRPTLLYEMDTIRLDDRRFALIVRVRRSPLGPYMIESYGETRYYVRHGSRTAPMTEREVSDAYALSARAQESRAATWEAHAMPLDPPTDQPWLTVAAIPEEPLSEVFDPADVDLEALTPSASMRIHPLHLRYTRLEEATQRLTIWADGIHGDSTYGEDRPPRALFRLHRDGSALLADGYPERVGISSIIRGLNAQLGYLAWLWRSHAVVRTEAEIDLRLENLQMARVDEPDSFRDEVREPKQPIAGPAPKVAMRQVLLPADLARPSSRHRLLLQFATRLYQAFNFPKPMLLFRWGHLYDQRGPLHLSIAGRGVYNDDGNEIAQVDDRGGILNRGGYVVAYFTDGVVVDLAGSAIGALELAPGSALPGDYFPAELYDDPRFKTPGGVGSATQARHRDDPPRPTGKWSDESLGGLAGGTERPRSP